MFSKSGAPLSTSSPRSSLAALVLSAALVGCRENEGHSAQPELRPTAEPLQVHSLREVPSLAEGGRVYLTNITLVPINSLSNAVVGTQYQVVDAHGERMLAVVDAPRESFLWSLTPSAAGRSYTDFGAIKKLQDGTPVLSIFKLAN